VKDKKQVFLNRKKAADYPPTDILTRPDRLRPKKLRPQKKKAHYPPWTADKTESARPPGPSDIKMTAFTAVKNFKSFEKISTPPECLGPKKSILDTPVDRVSNLRGKSPNSIPMSLILLKLHPGDFSFRRVDFNR